MNHQPIILNTKKQMQTYMSPVRQELLRVMSVRGYPMTPKEISDIMGISPSSVQHHIKKLMELGVIELDHEELIRGITARYYLMTEREINIQPEQGRPYIGEEKALFYNSINQVMNGYFQSVEQELKAGHLEISDKSNHMANGIVHLTQTEHDELLKLIRNFFDTHNNPGDHTEPWDFALIAYKAEV